MPASTFGHWIKQRRKELDLTQDELALRIGCSLVLIQKIEAGERHPSRQIAELLARNLAVPKDEQIDFVRFARGKSLPATSDHPAPWRGLRQSYTNLPVQATPLFGREPIIEAISHRLLHEQVRLLTLVGPPGAGKTRLAIETATRLVNDFDDGVFMVPLSSIIEPDLVLTTLARTFDIKESTAQPLIERVKTNLANKRLLLLLDNMEQVISAAAIVAELLAACPWICILATSRAPLHIRAERQFPVPPLDHPPLTSTLDPQSLIQYAAVAFFIDRAQAVDPEFILTPENAPDIVEICSRLDGLPLAIELVAASARQIPKKELLARLNRPIDLSPSTPVDLPPRHHSLQNAIQWSYDLLSKNEATVFTRLSVFAGGSTLEAINPICGPVTEASARESVNCLVEKNLVQRHTTAGHRTRFIMLETIRAYALGKLEETGEKESIQQRFVMCMLEMAEQTGLSQESRLDLLDDEQDNLRAALGLACEKEDAEKMLRFCAALWDFWQLHGYLSEGLKWLDAAMRMKTREDLTYFRAKALLGQGWLLRDFGDFSRMKVCFEESLAGFEKLDEKQDYAYALYSVGYAHFLIGDSRQGIQMIHKSLAIYHRLKHSGGKALTLFMLGRIAVGMGEFVKAYSCLSKCLQIEQERNSTFGVARTLGNLGELAIYQGNHEQANLYLTQSQELLNKIGEKQLFAWVLIKRGELAWRLGRNIEATRFFQQSLNLAQQIGYKWNIAYAFTYLGLSALTGGDPEMAQSYCENSLKIFQDLESEGDIVQTGKDLARVLVSCGDFSRAKQLYQQGLVVFSRRSYMPDVIECLEGLASIWAVQGNPCKAASLLGTAQALRDRLGAPLSPVLSNDYANTLNEIRAKVNPQDFTNAWSQGLLEAQSPIVDWIEAYLEK